MVSFEMFITLMQICVALWWLYEAAKYRKSCVLFLREHEIFQEKIKHLDYMRKAYENKLKKILGEND